MEKHRRRPTALAEAAGSHPKPLMVGDAETILCGVVLAGGEGKRLQPFIRSLTGQSLPKQFVNFVGRRSMIEHTFERVEMLIPPERVFTIVARRHLKYAEIRRQLASRTAGTVVLQPENRETGPGLLLPLMHLYKRYPNSVTVVFPADHFVLEEERLMQQVRLASLIAQRDPSRLVLLGVKPDTEEPEYGYIMPGKNVSTVAVNSAEVSWFVEKPDAVTARRLIISGALWNTMIMVFRTATLLHWVRQLAPAMFAGFEKVYDAIGTEREKEVARDVYRGLEPVNFSKELLEPMVSHFPSSLITVPLRDVFWSDWGTAGRMLDVLRRTGKLTRLIGRSKGAGVYKQPEARGVNSAGSLGAPAKEFAAAPLHNERSVV